MKVVLVMLEAKGPSGDWCEVMRTGSESYP